MNSQSQDQQKSNFESSPQELREFCNNSAIWRDFLKVLQARVELIDRDMNNVHVTDTMEKIRFLQGERRGVEFWINLPDEVIRAGEELEKELNNE